MAERMDQGQLEITVERDKDISYIGINGHDLIRLVEPGEDGIAEILVWSTTGSDARIAFQGKVQVRAREEEDNEDDA